MTVVLELQQQDAGFLDALRVQHPADIELVQLHRFDGTSDIIHAIILLSVATLPAVSKVILELIRARKYHKVKYRGTEITGLSEDATLEALAKLLADNDDTL